MTQQQQTDLLAVSDATANYRTAVAQLFTSSQDDDFSRIDDLGVSGFIDYVQQKANSADDTVDLGFLRARTDIYRVRRVHARHRFGDPTLYIAGARRDRAGIECGGDAG